VWGLQVTIGTQVVAIDTSKGALTGGVAPARGWQARRVPAVQRLHGAPPGRRERTQRIKPLDGRTQHEDSMITRAYPAHTPTLTHTDLLTNARHRLPLSHVHIHKPALTHKYTSKLIKNHARAHRRTHCPHPPNHTHTLTHMCVPKRRTSSSGSSSAGPSSTRGAMNLNSCCTDSRLPTRTPWLSSVWTTCGQHRFDRRQGAGRWAVANPAPLASTQLKFGHPHPPKLWTWEHRFESSSARSWRWHWLRRGGAQGTARHNGLS
jgi:hypothetical protein